MIKNGINNMAGIGRWAFAVALGCACLLGCGDSSTGPQPPAAKDYRVYFTDTQDSVLFSYVPATGELDSMPVPFTIRGITVSPDGREVYLWTGNATMLYTPADNRLSSYADSTVGLSFSPDGSLFAFYGPTLQVYRRADSTLVFEDTVELALMYFTNDNSRLFGLIQQRYNAVAYWADLNGNQQTWRKDFGNDVMSLLPTSDGGELFTLEMVSDYDWAFEAYDVAADSIVFSQVFSPGWGWMARTPDDRYVFYTNPGGFVDFGTAPPPNTITVFDVEQNAIIKAIPTGTMVPTDTGEVWQDFPVWLVTVTADGRWLVGLSEYSYGIVVTVDIQTLEVVRYDLLGKWRLLFYLDTQAGR